MSLSLSLSLSLLLLLATSLPVLCLNANFGQTLATFSGGSDGLWWPYNLALDSTNSVFVTDLRVSANYYAERGHLLKYGSGGADLTSDLNLGLLNTFVVEEEVYYAQSSLVYIAFDANDNLHTNNFSTIVKMNKNAQAVVMTFPSLYSDVGGLTVDKKTGNLFVFSPTDQMMYTQSSNGSLLYSYSTSALGSSTALGELSFISSAQLLLAVDTNNQAAYWLTLNGTLVNQYSTPGLMTACAVDANNNALLMIADADPSGYGDGINWRILSFAAPSYTAITTYPIKQTYAYFVSMAVGTDANIYLLDYLLARVSIFTPSTSQLTGQIRNGWTPGYFSTDNAGNVFICDTNTGDLLMLNADGSFAKWFSMTGFADGNSQCLWSAVNSAGTVLASSSGGGVTTVNGSLDGQVIYLFNVASGQVMNTIRVANGSYYGTDSLAVDNSGNIYYVLDSDQTTLQVVSSSGAAVRSIALRQSGLLSWYTANIDTNQKLNVFYQYNDNTQFVWDQLTLTGTVLQSQSVMNAGNATYNETINGPRVDYMNYLYYMVQISNQQGRGGSGLESQIRVRTPNGTTIQFWTDQEVLDDPLTLAIDGAGNVYTDDGEEHKIVKFVGVNYVPTPSSSNQATAVRGVDSIWRRVVLTVGMMGMVAALW